MSPRKKSAYSCCKLTAIDCQSGQILTEEMLQSTTAQPLLAIIAEDGPVSQKQIADQNFLNAGRPLMTMPVACLMQILLQELDSKADAQSVELKQ